MSRQAPVWVRRIVTEVCNWYGVDEPQITWRRSRKNVASSGHCDSDARRIVITAGSDHKDAKLALLHELAHWIAPAKSHHNAAFWAVAIELYRRHKLIRQALWSEHPAFKTAWRKSQRSRRRASVTHLTRPGLDSGMDRGID